MKTCSKCLEDKPLQAFYTKKTGRDGLTARCRPCVQAGNRAWVDANGRASRPYQRISPEARRRYRLKYRHHLTVEGFEAILAAQGGTCALCDRTTFLVVDHNHACCATTYKKEKTCGSCTRGILCQACNTALGVLGDSMVV